MLARIMSPDISKKSSIDFSRLALLLFCVATVLLIPLERFVLGGTFWLAGILTLTRVPASIRFRLGILYGAVACLALAPINTDRSNSHMAQLALWMTVVVLAPAALMRWHEPGALEWRLLPRRLQWLDIFYVAISIPLAWGVLKFYLFLANPELPTHWPMPADFDPEARWRLIAGINAVGVWDELFFVNTVYGILRTLFPKRLANLAQAVVYTAVLYHMAFTGIGPLVVYAFALTQGAMYERSRCLLFVLIVHLIVDAFLVAAILQYHYPRTGFHWF